MKGSRPGPNKRVVLNKKKLGIKGRRKSGVDRIETQHIVQRQIRTNKSGLFESYLTLDTTSVKEVLRLDKRTP